MFYNKYRCVIEKTIDIACFGYDKNTRNVSLSHLLRSTTLLIALAVFPSLQTAQSQQVCSVSTMPDSSLNIAIYKFKRQCSGYSRRDCDLMGNGIWQCSSAEIGSHSPTAANSIPNPPSAVQSVQQSNDVSTSGNAIILPGNDWYQIQNASNLISVYEGVGGRRYFVPDGTYHVINHTKGIRSNNLIVSGGWRSPSTTIHQTADVSLVDSSRPAERSAPPPRQFDTVVPLSSRNTQTRTSTRYSYQYPGKAPLRIFPGAQGFGTHSAGGRGGRICKVTNLNDAGVGSFRHCAEGAGPRIVVFETGGTIKLNSSVKIRHPFISIYGQTAPGDGILLRASLETTQGPVHIQTHDVLLQHLRIRAGISRHPNCCRDALLISNENKGNVYNVVIDHNSISWGTDQISHTWYDANNITYSNNLISESMHDNGTNTILKNGRTIKSPGGLGLLIGSEGSHSISVHNNMFTHSFQRNPLVKTSGIVDITNNLIYHWVSRGGQQTSEYKGQKVNWVKNHFIARYEGPDQSATGWGDILLHKTNYPMEVYLEGNIGHNRPDNQLPEWKIANTYYNTPYNPALAYHRAWRFPAPAVSEVDALDLQYILPPHVGASSPRRDSVDTRILSEFANRGGKMPNCVSQDDLPGDYRCLNNVGGWPHMATGIKRIDSDNDGIPDDWEISHGLDPDKDDSRLDFNNDGYLNIEDYAFDITQD